LPIVENVLFARFRSAMSRRPTGLAQLTAVGTFFFRNDPDSRLPGGFGHFGCCSLLVIQRVEAVAVIPAK
jgi:hypothetical protein